MENPRVSVIIPTHNRARTLRRAIDSVLGQSPADLEVIVVDDASTDSTPDLVREISDPRLRYTRHDENRFAGAARNQAAVETDVAPALVLGGSPLYAQRRDAGRHRTAI